MGVYTIGEILQKRVENAKKGWKRHKVPEYIKKYEGDNKRLKSFPTKRLKG